MKKTMIALLALSGIAMGASLTPDEPWSEKVDINADLLSDLKSKTFTLDYDYVDITITTSGTEWTTGAWESYQAGYKNTNTNIPQGTPGSAIGDAKLGTISHSALYGDGAQDMAMTYISAGKGKNITITFAGLDADFTYSLAVYSGLPFEGAGAWTKMSCSGTDKTCTIDPFSTVNCGVFDNLKPNADGQIIVTIPGNGSHSAVLNGLVITAIPEPTTATLSLLALAGLAVRRRRR